MHLSHKQASLFSSNRRLLHNDFRESLDMADAERAGAGLLHTPLDKDVPSIPPRPAGR